MSRAEIHFFDTLFYTKGNGKYEHTINLPILNDVMRSLINFTLEEHWITLTDIDKTYTFLQEYFN